MNALKEKVLLKELDLIDVTVSRLDTQMQKSKHFCIVIWLGVMGFLFSEQFKEVKYLKIAVRLSAFIPLLFWIMDYYWRKALLEVSRRQKLLSFFVNSTDSKNKIQTDFPLLDPTGKIYENEKHLKHMNEYSVKETPIYIKAWYYKEAKWFFPALIAFSLALSNFCC